MDYHRDRMGHGEIPVNMECVMNDNLTNEELGVLIRLVAMRQPISPTMDRLASSLNISVDDLLAMIDKFVLMDYVCQFNNPLGASRRSTTLRTFAFSNPDECSAITERFRFGYKMEFIR